MKVHTQSSSKTISFDDLYEKTMSDNPMISSFITGHLMIEFLMMRIIESTSPKLLGLAENLNHYRLIQLMYGLGHLSEDAKDILMKINTIRNKFAHDITFSPSIKEIRAIFLKAQKAFTDMTDGIEQGLEELTDKKSINECEDWLFKELFAQIAYDLNTIYERDA